MLQDSLRSAVYRCLTRPSSPIKKENGQTNGTSKHSSPIEANTPLQRTRVVHGPLCGLMEEEEEESQLQLFQASEGARELARMIDSFSTAPRLDARSKLIAKDLLRGARDLQSSLVMLTRLQEAAVKRRRRRKEVAAHSKRFAILMQDSRRSSDVSMSKPRHGPEFVEEDGSEETKGWRRCGLMREHTHSVYGSAKRFGSWNSRMEYTEEEISVDDDDDDEDDITSKSGVGGLRRMSTFKLREISEYAEEEEEIGVEEIMPWKKIGLEETRELRRVVADSLSRQSLLPRPSDYEFESRIESLTPRKGRSVVAKLMGLEEVPSERKKSLVEPRPAFDIDDRPNARKAQVPAERPNPTEKTTLHEIVAAMQFNGLLRSGRGDAPRFEKFSRSFREEDDVPPIVIMKPLFMPHWEREEGRKSLLRSVDSIAEEAKRNEEVKALTATVAQELQREKASKSIKRTDEKHKLLLAVRKEEEEEEEEETKENIMRKKKILISQANTTGSTVSTAKNKDSQLTPESKNSTRFAKENKNSTAKSVRKSTNAKSDGKHCEDRKRNNPHEGIDSSSKTRTLTARNQDDKQENLCEATQKTNQSVKITTARIASELEEDLMCLLLSSRSFINHAKELFHIDAYQPACYKKKGIGEDVMRNAKLYLDCGKELMVRRSQEHEVFKNIPMLRSSTRSLARWRSLGQLAEEVSRSIEVLTSYSEPEGDLYLRLERDLRGKEMMASANWDVGWTSSICGEEASLVIDELAELVVSWLIAEVAQDLVRNQRTP